MTLKRWRAAYSLKRQDDTEEMESGLQFEETVRLSRKAEELENDSKRVRCQVQVDETENNCKG